MAVAPCVLPTARRTRLARTSHRSEHAVKVGDAKANTGSRSRKRAPAIEDAEDAEDEDEAELVAGFGCGIEKTTTEPSPRQAASRPMRRDDDAFASDSDDTDDDDDDDDEKEDEDEVAAGSDSHDECCHPPAGSHCMHVIAAPPWRIANAKRARVGTDVRLDSFAPTLLAAADTGAVSIAQICRMLTWRRRPYTEWYLPSA